MPFTYAGQMFTNALNALKGWPIPTLLDIQGSFTANVNINSTNNPVLSGSCVHVQSLTAPASGTFGPNLVGFEMGANLTMMPCFVWPTSTDFDVANAGVPAGVPLGGNSTNIPSWVPILPAGIVVALVAKGPYELETTQYDTAQTYLPNQLLRAVTSNTDPNAGGLTNQNASGGAPYASPGLNVLYTDSIVGRVSRGTYTNANGITVLAFWPESIPGTR